MSMTGKIIIGKEHDEHATVVMNYPGTNIYSEWKSWKKNFNDA